MSIKVIAWKETDWFWCRECNVPVPKTEWRMWNHLCRAYDVELQMIDDWSEAIIPPDHTIILLEQNGNTSLENFTHPENAVYVVGKSGMNIHNMISHNCDVGECVVISTPVNISLFGVVAMGMVLYHRNIQ